MTLNHIGRDSNLKFSFSGGSVIKFNNVGSDGG